MHLARRGPAIRVARPGSRFSARCIITPRCGGNLTAGCRRTAGGCYEPESSATNALMSSKSTNPSPLQSPLRKLQFG